MATIALLAGAGLMGVGTVMQAQGQAAAGSAAAAEAEAAARQAESQRAIADYNAQLAENQAKAIEQKAAFDQQRQAEEAARRMSTMQAQLGASGAIPTVGSPLLIQAKQASEFELDNLMIGYEGRTQASQARSEAEIQRYQGRMAGWQAQVYRSQGKYAKSAAKQASRSTLITGFGGTALGLGSAFYTPSVGAGAGSTVGLGSPGVTGYHVP